MIIPKYGGCLTLCEAIRRLSGPTILQMLSVRIWIFVGKIGNEVRRIT